ncbi:MAG: hypothetical protein QG671_2936 [Actinomycetota bacterium]|nr:hypothetical protein [Actinomycetota bacterium]
MARARRARRTDRHSSSTRLVVTMAVTAAMLVGTGFGVYAATGLRVAGSTGSDIQVGSAPTVVVCPGDNGNGNGNGNGYAYGRCRNGNSDISVTAAVPLSR